MIKDHRTSLGIDPGEGGGCAVIRAGLVIDTLKLDGAGSFGIYDFVLKHWGVEPPLISIEAVPKWCGEEKFSIHAMTGSAMATMYGSFKFAHGICVGMGLEPQLLVPVKWQNLVECRNRRPKLERTAWKNKLKARAAELYPDFDRLTLWNSDAILIAHSGLLV